MAWAIKMGNAIFGKLHIGITTGITIGTTIGITIYLCMLFHGDTSVGDK